MTVYVIESGETLEFEVTTSEFLNVFDNELELVIVIGNKYNYRANAGSSISPPEPFTVFEVRNPHSEDLLFSFKNGMGNQSELAQVGDVVAVSSIVHPVTIGNFPAEQSVRVTNLSELNVSVDAPEVEVTIPESFTVNNLPEVQKVEATNRPTSINYLGNHRLSTTLGSMAAEPLRQGFIFYAPEENVEPAIINNIIFLKPGGHATLPISGEIYYRGRTGDRLRIAEVLYAV